MGKLGRALAAGAAAGLTTFGQGLMQQERDRRVDERLATEDAFKERDLDIREKDAAQRADVAARAKFWDDIKVKHHKFTKSWAEAEGNKHKEAQIMTDLFPDKRIYKYDERATNTVDPKTGKKPFAVMNLSFLDKDPITGEVKVDEFTGLPKEIITRQPTDKIVYETQEDYMKAMVGRASPEIYWSQAMQKLTTQQAIDKSNSIADAISKQPQGKSTLDKEAAQTAKLQAEEEKIRAEIDAGVGADGKKAAGSVITLDGTEKKLSTPEVNQLINDVKSIRATIPGATSGEVYRIGKAFENQAIVSGLQETARLIMKSKDKEAETQKAIESLMRNWRLKKATATEIISESLVGVKDTAPGFIKSITNKFLGADTAPEDKTSEAPQGRKHRGARATQ
jgi:hypothetical protein